MRVTSITPLPHRSYSCHVKTNYYCKFSPRKHNIWASNWIPCWHAQRSCCARPEQGGPRPCGRSVAGQWACLSVQPRGARVRRHGWVRDVTDDRHGTEGTCVHNFIISYPQPWGSRGSRMVLVSGPTYTLHAYYGVIHGDVWIIDRSTVRASLAGQCKASARVWTDWRIGAWRSSNVMHREEEVKRCVQICLKFGSAGMPTYVSKQSTWWIFCG
jgi:hypothetical protein